MTVGTVFEHSKIGLHIWLQAVHLISASKKGVSAKQLERMLGVTYKTAWFMAHRIREAMKAQPSRMLGGSGTSGIVEADETYWGSLEDAPKNKGGYGHKMKIVSLVERNGEKRSPIGPLDDHESTIFKKAGAKFAVHSTVNHSAKEYVRGEVTTNTIEASFAILKRGLTGTFHSVSEQHLQRYCNEFDFRWNYRASEGFNDIDRANMALKNIGGKRLLSAD